MDQRWGSGVMPVGEMGQENGHTIRQIQPELGLREVGGEVGQEGVGERGHQHCFEWKGRPSKHGSSQGGGQHVHWARHQEQGHGWLQQRRRYGAPRQE